MTGTPSLPGMTYDVPYPVATVHNAGVIKHNGRYIMLFRSHLHNGRSVIGQAESADGFSFSVHPEPFLVPSHDGIFAEYEEFGVEDLDGIFAEYEEFGVEDLRICPVEGDYLLAYSAYSRHGVRIALARTRDFEKVERIALITQADLRNVVIFPVKFGGRYARLDRPHSEISPWSIWISYSPDLVHWGDSRVIMKPVPYHWDWLGRCIALAWPCTALMIRQKSSAFPISGYCNPRIPGR